MKLDLDRWRGAFFEESFEALASMEAVLLKLDLGAPDAESINTIFRVAHSIKGGSAMFGFTEVASFTHSLETLLDELRSNGLQVTQAICDQLLKSVDVMREMLRAAQNGHAPDAQRVTDAQLEIELIIAQRPKGNAAAGGVRGKPRTVDSESDHLAWNEAGSIRVAVEKIDELMNTVGELVITQSMLAELGRSLNEKLPEAFQMGLAQLERNMRELQESVMRVRMLPISFVFSRFPRMVRDLAQRLGKQVELSVGGETTELDKTVLEKIGDPLVHLVRNSIDHGIETPEVRRAAGKPPVGSLRLHACHRGGNIVVEVTDDGAGLNAERILAKARANNLIGPSEALTDEQIYDLIFAPGFSTADQTTDVSGRGVGLDVVRRNVKELGGSIELTSEPGRGAKFTISLPLTLAIVDGQSVAVGRESYIVPLISIIESLQLTRGSLNRVAGRGEVFEFRGDYIPVIRLHEVFGVQRKLEAHEGIMVVVEGDGRRAGLIVDDLLGQQQVVIKSLDHNFGRIEGVSGATILGDGSVALILDLPGIIRRANARVHT